jgi:hypothetical protein
MQKQIEHDPNEKPGTQRVHPIDLMVWAAGMALIFYINRSGVLDPYFCQYLNMCS